MKLPTLATVLFIISLIIAGGAAFMGTVVSVSFPSSSEGENIIFDTPLAFICQAIIGIFFMVTTSAALQKKEWGRKGYSIGLLIIGTLTIIFNIAMVIHFSPTTPAIILMGIFTLLHLEILFLNWRYINSPKLKLTYLPQQISRDN